MNVYVLEVDNGYEYDDNESHVEGVFKTCRGASEYIVDKGFNPYAVQREETKGTDGWELCFEKVGGVDKNFEAWITEMELKN